MENNEYKGDFKNNKYEGKGKGIEYYENGNKRYEGDFNNGKFEGKGIVYYENGKIEYIKELKIKGKELDLIKMELKIM